MILAKITKLDQKNRIHIPYDYLRLLEIEYNAYVCVEVDTDANVITVRKVNPELVSRLDTKGALK